MRDLSFSKQAIIDYSTLKNRIVTNQAVFLLVNKTDKEIVRLFNTIKELQDEYHRMKQHYSNGQLDMDVVGFKEVCEKIPF